MKNPRILLILIIILLPLLGIFGVGALGSATSAGIFMVIVPIFVVLLIYSFIISIKQLIIQKKKANISAVTIVIISFLVIAGIITSFSNNFIKSVSWGRNHPNYLKFKEEINKEFKQPQLITDVITDYEQKDIYGDIPGFVFKLGSGRIVETGYCSLESKYYSEDNKIKLTQILKGNEVKLEFKEESYQDYLDKEEEFLQKNVNFPIPVYMYFGKVNDGGKLINCISIFGQ